MSHWMYNKVKFKCYYCEQEFETTVENCNYKRCKYQPENSPVLFSYRTICPYCNKEINKVDKDPNLLN